MCGYHRREKGAKREHDNPNPRFDSINILSSLDVSSMKVSVAHKNSDRRNLQQEILQSNGAKEGGEGLQE